MIDLLLELTEIIFILSLIWDNQFYCRKKPSINNKIFWPGFGYVFVVIAGLLLIPAKILEIEKRASRYLYNSVLTMPKNTEIKALLKSRGFERVSYKSMSFGIACMIIGYKPKE